MTTQEKTPLISTRSRRTKRSKHVLVIHGGAGTFSRSGSTPEQRAEYRAALEHALQQGNNVLSQGGEALDAVVAAVSAMEGEIRRRQPIGILKMILDNPLFNAAKGAVFNVAGKVCHQFDAFYTYLLIRFSQNELETSVMLSKPPASHPDLPASRRGLALTLLTRARNPSKLVRALYLQPDLVPHTAMSGATAEDIGASLGEQLVDPSYFFTKKRWREHRLGLGLPEAPYPYPPKEDQTDVPLDQMPTGTVGAVALDVRGCIAALTSTGGKTNKLVGRIGDTPTMGSGFWAEEWKVHGWFHRIFFRKRTAAVGVSGTGDGDVRSCSSMSSPYVDLERIRYAVFHPLCHCFDTRQSYQIPARAFGQGRGACCGRVAS